MSPVAPALQAVFTAEPRDAFNRKQTSVSSQLPTRALPLCSHRYVYQKPGSSAYAEIHGSGLSPGEVYNPQLLVELHKFKTQ